MQGTLYFTTEFTRPWGLRVPCFERVARFHLVVRGSTWVRVVSDQALEPFLLEAGDLVLIPHGTEHVLADSPDTPCRTVDEVVREAGFIGQGALVHGGDGDGTAPTRLVCGHFEFDDGFDHPFLTQLPPALVVRWQEAVRDSPLEDVFRFIAREVQEGRPGHAAVTRRLSEVLLVQAIRVWADGTDHRTGVMAALARPGLGEALSAIHAEPARPWTLESLARKAAMGRTTFAQQFREVVGTPPHQYLVHWRMQHARRLLSESSLSIERIARRLGYESAASFSRVFKKVVGLPPGAYRRRGGVDGGSTESRSA